MMIFIKMHVNGVLSRMLRLLAVSVCLFLAAGQVRAQERSYMEQLSVDEGLPHTDVSAIVLPKETQSAE